MEKKDILLFKGSFVAIGVDHWVLPGKLFYHRGVILSINDKTVVMKILADNSIKEFPLDDIRSIGYAKTGRFQ